MLNGSLKFQILSIDSVGLTKFHGLSREKIMNFTQDIFRTIAYILSLDFRRNRFY